MFGDYFTPNIVSRCADDSMIGNQIDSYFHVGGQPTIGAAITVVLAAFLTVLMAYYPWTIHKVHARTERMSTVAGGPAAASLGPGPGSAAG